MEDNLKKCVNGRQLQKKMKMEDNLKQICKWKANSNKFVNGRLPRKKLYLEENFIFFCKWKTTYIGLEIEDYLKKSIISRPEYFL